MIISSTPVSYARITIQLTAYFYWILQTPSPVWVCGGGWLSVCQVLCDCVLFPALGLHADNIIFLLCWQKLHIHADIYVLTFRIQIKETHVQITHKSSCMFFFFFFFFLFCFLFVCLFVCFFFTAASSDFPVWCSLTIERYKLHLFHRKKI